MGWSKAFNVVFPFIKTWIAKRQIRLQAKIDIQRIQAEGDVERAKSRATATIDYDLEVLRQRQFTYMDELLILGVFAILAMCFIPSLQETAKAGFLVIEDMPSWFQVLVMGVYISNLGIRFMFGSKHKSS